MEKPIPTPAPPVLKTALSIPGGNLLAHFYDYDYFEKCMKAEALLLQRAQEIERLQRTIERLLHQRAIGCANGFD